MGLSLNNIGIVYNYRGDYEKALICYTRALNMQEEIGYKGGVGYSLVNIGNVYVNRGDLDTALDYYERSHAIYEELGMVARKGTSLYCIGEVYHGKGDYDKTLDYYERSLAIFEKLGDKYNIEFCLSRIGILYHDKCAYKKAEEYIEKSFAGQKPAGISDMLGDTTYLCLTYKHLGKEYDENKIQALIKETENIEYELNLRLYELLEDKSYLETAYNQVQEKAGNLEPDIAAKFLSYPIPKAIVDEWEKVTAHKN
jgi:tetratricopeptide (TPR) repeat protein